jgi:hypothetical protein
VSLFMTDPALRSARAESTYCYSSGPSSARTLAQLLGLGERYYRLIRAQALELALFHQPPAKQQARRYSHRWILSASSASPAAVFSWPKSNGTGGSHCLVGGAEGIRTAGPILLKVWFLVALEQICCTRKLVV